jgi:hypothetical protein
MSRLRGWALICLGTFLIVLMGGLSVLVAGIIAGSKNPEATTRFTGHATDALYMYGVFSLVLMFGAVAVVSGVSEIRHGKIDRRLLVPVLWTGAALLVFGEFLLLVFRR